MVSVEMLHHIRLRQKSDVNGRARTRRNKQSPIQATADLTSGWRQIRAARRLLLAPVCHHQRRSLRPPEGASRCVQVTGDVSADLRTPTPAMLA